MDFNRAAICSMIDVINILLCSIIDQTLDDTQTYEDITRANIKNMKIMTQVHDITHGAIAMIHSTGTAMDLLPALISIQETTGNTLHFSCTSRSEHIYETETYSDSGSDQESID